MGLQNVDQKPERASPVSRERAAEALAADCGFSQEDCATAIRNALIGFGTPEIQRGISGGTDEPLFAFKLHQFIAGAGRLYSTLRPEGQRDVTFSGQIYNPENEEERLYPVHFCRNCGQEFHPVTLRHDGGREYFEKREIDDIPVEADEDDEGAEWGFLMPEPADSDFTFAGNDENYPEAWLEETNRGDRRLKSVYRKRRAQPHNVATHRNLRGRASKLVHAWKVPLLPDVQDCRQHIGPRHQQACLPERRGPEFGDDDPDHQHPAMDE